MAMSDEDRKRLSKGSPTKPIVLTQPVVTTELSPNGEYIVHKSSDKPKKIGGR